MSYAGNHSLKRGCVLLVLLSISIAGCLSVKDARKPNANQISKIRTIEIIPLESPPFFLLGELPQSIYTQVFANAGRTASVSGQPAGAAVVLLTAPLMALDMQDQLDREIERQKALVKKPGKIEAKSAKKDAVWNPNLVLANEMRTRIESARLFTVAPITRYHTLPISDRSATRYAGILMDAKDITRHMAVWGAPIRDWYDEETATVGYTEAGSVSVDAIVEVGLMSWHYDTRADVVMIEVMAKVIAPRSGKILGRTRKIEYETGVGNLDKLLTNDAEQLKQLVIKLNEKAIADISSDLRLVAD